MESSQLFGGTEECHSSESGWTMYIGSPMHGGDDDGAHSDDDDHENYDGDDCSGGDDDDDDEDDSDDSMASDASSGPPSHQGHPFGNREDTTGHGMGHLKHEDDDGKCFYDKKANKKPLLEKKRAERRRKEEKEEMVFMAERVSSTAPAQSGSKVRKNIRRSQRK